MVDLLSHNWIMTNMKPTQAIFARRDTLGGKEAVMFSQGRLAGPGADSGGSGVSLG